MESGIIKRGRPGRRRGKKRKSPRPNERPGAYRYLSGLYDVNGPGSFRARLDIEVYVIAFRKGLEAIARDGREMDEYVFAVVCSDETETLRLIEPFY